MKLEEQIKQLVSIHWNEAEFGQSKMKADYKHQLHSVIMLDDLNNIHYKGLTHFISNSEVMYEAESGGKHYKFISATVEKSTEGKGRDGKDFLKVKFGKPFSPFAKLVVDYLLGRFTFFNNQLFDVNDRQAKPLDEFAIVSLYGFRKEATYILDILKGIDKTLKIKPVRELAPYQISGQDFTIDLEQHRLTRTTLDPNKSFFKFYDVDFETAKQAQTMATKFLNYVIADEDSLHNATLQTYYMAQVASGLKAKQNFFIDKSGVRTGKGLRHIALSGLFNKIDVELDNLVGSGFEVMNAWATFSGGEMALATEQGDIIGDKMERALKIIATEKTHVARNIGGNQGLVLLSSVLCIDTNRNVSLSDEMNGRRVQIQFKDRPEGETSLERERIFSEYWKTFTHQDKSPKIEGSIGFLFASLDYFQRVGEIFEWKDVEVFNDVDLDDFQIYLINTLQSTDFVERNEYLSHLHKQTYGTNGVRAGNALRTIGVKYARQGSDKIPGYKVDNPKRFKSFIAPTEEASKDDEQVELRLFEVFNNI